jgi:DNA-directed RNA polymerase specialized sigma24 family protein
MGSVIDGEDVVQDTFARGLVAPDELEEGAPLFRIAHNRAMRRSAFWVSPRERGDSLGGP